MPFTLEVDSLPLAMDDYGIIHVSGTRVTLDTVIGAFLQGQTAEQIAHDYDSIPLPDIYLVIGYYLKHQAQVDQYLQQGRDDSANVRLENQGRFPSTGIRERLLARSKAVPQPPQVPHP